ncbi:MAG: hypothetical protein ACOX8S_10535 [Christensenellales bacterium]
MLYPKNESPKLSDERFLNPESEYRGAPFWAWNNKLNAEQLKRQIEQMKEMGLGGFHMHSRSGMATEYLGDEFMHMVKECVEKAKEENMLAWLYDEDRWPSGAAGGIVTKNKKYRARFLVFTKTSDDDFTATGVDIASKAQAVRNDKGTFLARYDVELDDGGYLKSYRLLNEGEAAKHDLWYAYMGLAMESPWFNNQTYLNTLDPEAVKEFVKVTYERYKEIVGGDFGKAVPAIFTDEPQFPKKAMLAFAKDSHDVFLPWTDDLPLSYADAYDGADILATVPELFWDLPKSAPSLHRYRYHDHIAERFASAFADTCGDWCEENGLMLTGHMMSEESLLSQTGALGEAMRSYRSFHLPGIDLLCDKHEYSTAKQAQSASRQYGCPGVLSELYGVTNWDFDFRGHKMQGDWQAAMGVTTRVHHLTWVSMEGEAKRDYPASIGYQSAWYKEYPLIEDHFARLNTALTRGKPIVKVGVIHPIESYWLRWGPNEHTALERQEMDDNFQNVIRWLLFGQIDFDFVCESLLPEQCDMGGFPLKVGQMEYDAIVVPAMTTMRKTTFERLEAFKKAGGRLIVMGDAPSLMDAVPSGDIAAITDGALNISISNSSLMAALEDLRVVDVRDASGGSSIMRMADNSGNRAHNLLYQLRQDGDDKWLFICHGDRPKHIDVMHDEIIKISVKGEYSPVLYDTLTGDITPLGADYAAGNTIITRYLNACDSVLLKLIPGRAAAADVQLKPIDRSGEFMPTQVPVTLAEPNVLLLDIARYKFNDESDWNDDEEILKIDDKLRKKIGYPLRMEGFAQPWVVPDEPSQNVIKLLYEFESEIDCAGCKVALERPESARMLVNGAHVQMDPDGYFVDESIKTVAIPAIQKGLNTVEIHVPITRRVGAEPAYLLGDFGVRLTGSKKTLTAPVRQLGFGDITRQGLPFYAGNVIYHLPAEGVKNAELSVTHYRGGLVAVDIAGKRQGEIVFPPYRLDIQVPEGTQTIDVTLFGTRVNAFGSIHNSDFSVTWFGPNAWRSDDDRWSYEYQLRPQGILAAPRIKAK